MDAAHQLVQEQLEARRIELSTSLWNTPIFLIRKKWLILQVLTYVSKTVMIMGAAQRVLPTAVRIPNFQIFGDGPDGIVTH